MINNITLVGRLTKDPELKYTPSGVAVANFTLAVNRKFSNQQGEKETDFINCVVWRKQAENAANFLKKGHLAGVEGSLQTRNYEGQDGKRVYVSEVIADSVQFLEPKRDSQPTGQQGQMNQPTNQQQQQPSFQQQQQQQPTFQQQSYSQQQQQPSFQQNQQMVGAGAGNGGQLGGFSQNGQQGNSTYQPYPNHGPIEVSDDDLPF